MAISCVPLYKTEGRKAASAGGGPSELRLKGFALAGPQVFNWNLQFL